jgi:hypothetical protein
VENENYVISSRKHVPFGSEVTVLLKERIIIKRYIPKKHKYFGINTD